jgi:hypothetical protein
MAASPVLSQWVHVENILKRNHSRRFRRPENRELKVVGACSNRWSRWQQGIDRVISVGKELLFLTVRDGAGIKYKLMEVMVYF